VNGAVIKYEVHSVHSTVSGKRSLLYTRPIQSRKRQTHRTAN